MFGGMHDVYTEHVIHEYITTTFREKELDTSVRALLLLSAVQVYAQQLSATC